MDIGMDVTAKRGAPSPQQAMSRITVLLKRPPTLGTGACFEKNPTSSILALTAQYKWHFTKKAVAACACWWLQIFRRRIRALHAAGDGKPCAGRHSPARRRSGRNLPISVAAMFTVTAWRGWVRDGVA